MKPIEYRFIAGFPNHRVGSDGSVWTRSPFGGKGALTEWRRLKAQRKEKGHLMVYLWRAGQRRTDVFVHVLVLGAFVGPKPPGMQCRHFPDRDPANNRLENLSWGTHQQNQDDSAVHGTRARGEKNGSSKLTDKEVLAIRAEVGSGATQAQTARNHGVVQSVVSVIVNRKRWTHV